MMQATQRALRAVTACMVIAAVAAFFVLIDRNARAARRLPPASSFTGGETRVLSVETQKEAYAVLRSLDLWGVHLVHLNQFFNLVDFFPKEEASSAPFPIRTGDIRPAYEQGLDSHNWLFIATRTGLVRRITSVLPDSSFRERVSDLRRTLVFSGSEDRLLGYSYDTPWTVATLAGMGTISEPVVLTIDAGFFRDGDTPSRVIGLLRERCSDIRVVAFISSQDEPETTDVMRRSLAAATAIWRVRP